MRPTHLPYLESARANKAQGQLGAVGMHAQLKREDREKLVGLYLPLEQYRAVMPPDEAPENRVREAGGKFCAVHHAVRGATAHSVQGHRSSEEPWSVIRSVSRFQKASPIVCNGTLELGQSSQKG